MRSKPIKSKILYISYNGMNEALGASQVLSYLYKLSVYYEYHLVSLEKPYDFSNQEKMNTLNTTLKEKNIHWYPIEYKMDKIGKNLNFFRLLYKVNSIIKKEKIRFLHCRSYFPAMVALLLKRKHKLKYLFDTRGFVFDERADVGSIKRGSIAHSFFKVIEKKMYLNASGVIILSETGKKTVLHNELFLGGDKMKNIEVITTCVDLDRFVFHKRNFEKNKYVIGYVGTAVGWYDFEKTIKTLKQIKKQLDFHFLIFNSNAHDQHKYIEQTLTENGFSGSEFSIEEVSFTDMPNRLKEIDISLFYIHPFFSKRASAATKLGELLASGIPVITNANVGDHEYLLENYMVGKIIRYEEIDTYNYANIFSQLINPETALRCRKLAESYFSINQGVEKYIESYNKYFFDSKAGSEK